MRPTGEWLARPGGLADRLREIRKSAGLTGAQLAKQLGWAQSKVPKLENGRQMPAEADLAAWAQAAGQPEAVPELLAMLAEAQQVHRQFRHQLRRGLTAIQEDLDKLVRQAKRIRDVETMFVPGLLHTPGYARYRMLEAVRVKGFAEEDVERAVAAKMRRQQILYEGGREFEFIIMETALLVRACPPQEMLGQLDRLEVAAGMAGVTLAIIPLAAQLPVVPDVGFLVLDDVAYIETPTSEDLARGEEAARYARIADACRAEAVTGDEARELIAAAARTLRQRSTS